MFLLRTSLGPVELAFTDRHGGVSGAPYDSLNLAAEGGDDPAACAENLHRVLEAFAPGARVAQMRQVHGSTVALVTDAPEPAPGSAAAPVEADAIVTDRADTVLVVRAADCVPVVLADAEAGLVAVVHAGRPGVEQGVVPRTVATLREHGARRLTAWVGPHVCGGCYEVPAELQRRVVAAEPATEATTTWGTPSLDIGAGVRAQLDRAGADVHGLSACTRESADLYSYRRDGAGAGRLAGLVRVRG